MADNSGERKKWISSEWDLMGRVNRMEDGLSERRSGIKGVFALRAMPKKENLFNHENYSSWVR